MKLTVELISEFLLNERDGSSFKYKLQRLLFFLNQIWITGYYNKRKLINV